MSNPETLNTDLAKVIRLTEVQGLVTPSDINAALRDINTRYARELLGILTRDGLFTTDEDPETGMTWFINPDRFTGDSLADLDPESEAARITGVYRTAATKHKATSKPKAPTANRGAFNADGSARTCLCGCGQQVQGKSVYRPGHDARHAGQVARQIAAGSNDRDALLATLGSDALRAKATAHADRLTAKATKKATKTAFTPVHGTVKIGRWHREVWTTDDTATHPTGAYYLTAKGEQVTLPEDKYESVAWDPAQ